MENPCPSGGNFLSAHMDYELSAVTIALGHPLGGSGAQIMTRMVHSMAETGTRYGLQTMCEGGGMANATILELL
jgi:hypothetical protein